MNNKVFLDRIHEVQDKLEDGSVLLVFGAGHKIRNSDVEYKFRQDSDFFYLTGISEADALLVLKRDYSAAFVLPKDPASEIWTGYRIGPKGFRDILQLDEAFENTALETKLSELLLNQETLYYSFGKENEKDAVVFHALQKMRARAREGKTGPERIEIPYFLHEMRLHKSIDEIDSIREAARITKLGHERLFREAQPGLWEYQLEAILESEYLGQGAWGGGYGHIVASGKNATVLHYTSNNCQIQENDLVLVDSGAEKNGYTADVTRTFPASGKFTEPQREIYELVLDAQLKAIDSSRKGVAFNDVHEATVVNLVQGLMDLKILKGSMQEILEKKLFRKYYMHRTGHFMGMDVHDVGKYFLAGKSRPLENGMVVTVEPGLYFSPEDPTVPSRYKGIGIRIEDDILIQDDKPINLTGEIAKTMEEIELICS